MPLIILTSHGIILTNAGPQAVNTPNVSIDDSGTFSQTLELLRRFSNSLQSCELTPSPGVYKQMPCPIVIGVFGMILMILILEPKRDKA